MRQQVKELQLVPGNCYNVKVVKLVRFGAVVELVDNPGQTELVHISNIADCYVQDIADYVQVGDVYKSTCQVGKSRPIELSFIPLGLAGNNSQR